MGLASKNISIVGKEWFRLCAWGRQSLAEFGIKGISGRGLRWLSLKGWKPIGGDILRVGLTSPPQGGTGVIQVRILSEERLLEASEEGS